MNIPLLEKPRTYKYAIPGIVVVLLIPVTRKMSASPNPEIQYWSVVPLGLCVLFAIIFLVNLLKYITVHRADILSKRQAALSTTPLGLISNSMNRMHPEAIRVLGSFGVRTSQDVKTNTNLGQRDWVLDGTNAHLGFVEFVLSQSWTSLYPKGNLSEGSKKWDPDGLIQDREQYDELEKWLISHRMVERPAQNRAAEFIWPWTSQLIMKTIGLTGEHAPDPPQPSDS